MNILYRLTCAALATTAMVYTAVGVSQLRAQGPGDPGPGPSGTLCLRFYEHSTDKHWECESPYGGDIVGDCGSVGCEDSNTSPSDECPSEGYVYGFKRGEAPKKWIATVETSENSYTAIPTQCWWKVECEKEGPELLKGCDGSGPVADPPTDGPLSGQPGEISHSGSRSCSDQVSGLYCYTCSDGTVAIAGNDNSRSITLYEEGECPE